MAIMSPVAFKHPSLRALDNPERPKRLINLILLSFFARSLTKEDVPSVELSSTTISSTSYISEIPSNSSNNGSIFLRSLNVGTVSYTHLRAHET